MPPSPLNPATTRHRRKSPSVSVVIPVRNPGGLSLMLRGLPAVDEVIVVSEGPASETTAAQTAAAQTAAAQTAAAQTAAAAHAACPHALVIRPGREGVGNALASGIAASRGDVVVTLNGDGSTDPGEIPRYVAALTAGADVAFGSRYCRGGRDLTGGRFHRWADQLLIWLVNALFGTRRTDPGYGYAAFWRDALDRLDLPDPSADSAATWGDGPELGPLLSLRPSARGMTVTEVAGTAYPRISRPTRAERPGLRHWARVIADEYRHRRTATPLTPAVPVPGSRAAVRTAPARLNAAAQSAAAFGAHPRHAAQRHPTSQPNPATHTDPAAQGGQATPLGLAPRTDPAAQHDSAAQAGAAGGAGPDAQTDAARWAGYTARAGSAGQAGSPAPGGPAPSPAGRRSSDRQSSGEPLWGPPRRRPAPGRDLWRAGENPIPFASPRSIANVTPHAWPTGHTARATGPDVKPRSADDPRPDPASPDIARSDIAGPDIARPDIARTDIARPDIALGRPATPQPPAPREVGAKRRRLEAYRQRPDLRVINGEGTGGGRPRSGRLRPVPRENLGG